MRNESWGRGDWICNRRKNRVRGGSGDDAARRDATRDEMARDGRWEMRDDQRCEVEDGRDERCKMGHER